MAQKAYDIQCGELAKSFLRDSMEGVSTEAVDSLAQTIQDAIENWFEDRNIEFDRP